MPNATPTLTEKNCPDLTSKTIIVTGGYSGIGASLSSILYSRNAKIYIAGRSPSKAAEAINAIKAEHPTSQGSLAFLEVDFADLKSVKPAAEMFLAREETLDILFNNAGVMIPPQGSRTVQGYELQLGTNCVGPFLFTTLLLPALERAASSSSSSSAGKDSTSAKESGKGAPRIVWVSSSASEGFSPKGGIDMGNLGYEEEKGAWVKYGSSKSGNIFHAAEAARRWGSRGIVSVSLDPGNLDTPLYQHIPSIIRFFIRKVALHPTIYGAYTELYAGLSDDVSLENNGVFIKPWGTLSQARKDVHESCTNGTAEKFWDWTEEQVKSFM